jgi:hypothetical protein
MATVADYGHDLLFGTFLTPVSYTQLTLPTTERV